MVRWCGLLGKVNGWHTSEKWFGVLGALVYAREKCRVKEYSHENEVHKE